MIAQVEWKLSSDGLGRLNGPRIATVLHARHMVEKAGVPNSVVSNDALAVDIMPKVALHRLTFLAKRSKPGPQIGRLSPFGHGHSMNESPAMGIKIGTAFPGVEVAAFFPVESHGVATLQEDIQHTPNFLLLVDRIGRRQCRSVIHFVPSHVFVAILVIVSPVTESPAIQVRIGRQQIKLLIFFQMMHPLTLVKVVHPVGVGFLTGQFVTGSSPGRVQIRKGRVGKGAFLYPTRARFFNDLRSFFPLLLRNKFLKENISKPDFLAHKFRLFYPVNLKTNMPRASHPIKFKIRDRNIIDKGLIAIIERPN